MGVLVKNNDMSLPNLERKLYKSTCSMVYEAKCIMVKKHTFIIVAICIGQDIKPRTTTKPILLIFLLIGFVYKMLFSEFESYLCFIGVCFQNLLNYLFLLNSLVGCAMPVYLKTVYAFFHIFLDETLIFVMNIISLNLLHQDRGNPEAAVMVGYSGKCINCLQQKESSVDLQSESDQNTCVVCKLGGKLLWVIIFYWFMYEGYWLRCQHYFDFHTKCLFSFNGYIFIATQLCARADCNATYILFSLSFIDFVKYCSLMAFVHFQVLRWKRVQKRIPSFLSKSSF